MNVTHVEFIQFGKKAVFYFTAPERVDFRGLVKDLVGDLKMRIELRQISVRDRAAALGATGACGLQTCCSSFLNNYGNVSIKMAKNQNLALIPSKINGVCGQIKCCIKYEDDVYSAKRKLLPREQSFIRTKNGDLGKVTKLHLILEQFEMLTDKGYIRRYARSQFNDKNYFPPKSWSFPTEFRSIVSETSTIIGLDDENEKLLDRYSHEIPDDELDSVGEEAEVDNDDVKLEDIVIEKELLSDEESEDDEATNKSKSTNQNRDNRQQRKGGNRNNRNRNYSRGGNRNNRAGQTDNENKPKHETSSQHPQDSQNKSGNRKGRNNRYRRGNNRNNQNKKQDTNKE